MAKIALFMNALPAETLRTLNALHTLKRFLLKFAQLKHLPAASANANVLPAPRERPKC